MQLLSTENRGSNIGSSTGHETLARDSSKKKRREVHGDGKRKYMPFGGGIGASENFEIFEDARDSLVESQRAGLD